MGILVGFAPFLAFFVGIRQISPVAGLAAACLVSLYLCLRMWRRGASVKVLEVGSLALFAALLGYTLLVSPAWTIATVRLAVDAGLFAIAAISLLIGKPFTLQYAKEQVPAEFWESLYRRQPAHHAGLGDRLCGDGGGRRRRRVHGRDSDLGGRGGDARGAWRGDPVHHPVPAHRAPRRRRRKLMPAARLRSPRGSGMLAYSTTGGPTSPRAPPRRLPILPPRAVMGW